MPFEVDLPTILQNAIDASLNEVGVAMPGTVVSYSNGKASVKPGLHKLIPALDDDDVDLVEEQPTIQNVSVIWPRGRNFSIQGTLVAGDPVLLVCLDRDPSGWLQTGQPAEPDDTRVHHWSNAVAIPGLLAGPTTWPTTDALVLASKLDSFLRTISGLVDTITPNSAETATLAIIQAARALVGGGSGVPGVGTVGSAVFKTTA